MKAEIICVGTELLLGDILNTNAQFLSKELAAMGFSVYFQTVVGDNTERLEEAIALAKSRCDLLVFSGGLGPTEDDLTKETVAKAFHDELVLDEKVLENLKALFAKRHYGGMTHNNYKQAYVPVKGNILENKNGTAPGAVFYDAEKIAILLPGPPREMELMFQNAVRPMLQAMQDSVITSLVLNTFGIGESSLEEMVLPLLNGTNPTAALYAKEGEVHIRITAKAETEELAWQMCEAYAKQFEPILGAHIYGRNSEGLEYEVVHALAKTNETIATAESCTGGLLSGRITAVPGASSVFECGVCSYSGRIKHALLGVPQSLLNLYSEVSGQVAIAMAQGAAKLAGANYGAGITGIAGPTGGTEDKPVGLVYVAVWYNGKAYLKKLLLTGADRGRVRRMATQHTLDMVRRLANGVAVEQTEVLTNEQLESYMYS